MTTEVEIHPHHYWPLWQLVRSRLTEFVREPEALFWVYGFPILMTVALGIAFRNQPVEQVVVAIIDNSSAADTQQALVSTKTDERFKATILSMDVARLKLRTGKTDLVVIASHVDGTLQYQYLFDPTRPQSVLARNAVDDQLQRSAGRKDVATTRTIKVEEPGSRYIDFLVPGLLGMSLMGGGLWGVGFVTVDMRIRKLLKRFLATPMKKSHFLAAIMISRLTFMVPEVLIILIFARYAFHVVNHGSVAAVIVLILLGAFTFSGIGLLVASRAKTLEAVSGLMNLVMLPMWIMSGIFFSSERFPEAFQPIVQALPLTPLIDALRAVMLEGASLASQTSRLLALAAWGSITFVLSLRLFRWR
ncbi:MAG: ABC transporter permease [Pirellulales bacterium]|nr:ABC transporter permease [Pirellulales bacterium]